MANMTNWLEENILNSVFHGDATTWIPSGVYLALISAGADEEALEDGTAAGGAFTQEITEYSGDRVQLYVTTVTQEDGKAMLTNDGEIVYDDLPLGSIGYVAICDTEDKEQGNALFWGAANPLINVGPGDTVTIATNMLKVTLE